MLKAAANIMPRPFCFYRFPHDALLLLVFSLVEYVGYRQIFLFWRLAATWNFFFGRIAWRVSSRTGFATRAG
jgi:hypothetical protein